MLHPNTISLSYFMTTYNKLPYLKIAVNDLINNKLPDEEIVIADGGSTDGTAEWLKDLYEKKLIQQFISAKDFGEAHGANRAVLSCNGAVLKWINDDDVFCFEAIRECKEFLLKNADCDVVFGDGFDNYRGKTLEFISHKNQYIRWKTDKEPFGFYGPGLMIKKSSLSQLGLFNSLTKFVDNEYSFRITSLPCKIAYYTRPVFVRVINPESNTLKFDKARNTELQLNDVYRKIATGRSNFNFKFAESIKKIKGLIYNFLHSQSSTIKVEQFVVNDINLLYQNHKNTLIEAFKKSDTAEPFIY